jgi:hypothetical protein
VVEWSIAINSQREHVAQYALAYSEASIKEMRIRGIDIDDFLRAYRLWGSRESADAPALLEQVIDNAKAKNFSLMFGITLYEDELSSDLIQDIPANLRSRIDRVSLFVRFRANGPLYETYVEDAKRLFPNAIVWAGSYAYDRIDYQPCSQGRRDRCSEFQQLELYGTLIKIQAKMLKDGEIAAIEFYPGYFGQEERWQGWTKARNCAPHRRQRCITNTIALRDIAIEMLESYRP